MQSVFSVFSEIYKLLETCVSLKKHQRHYLLHQGKQGCKGLAWAKGLVGTIRSSTEVLHLDLCLLNVNARAKHTVPGTYLNWVLSEYG